MAQEQQEHTEQLEEKAKRYEQLYDTVRKELDERKQRAQAFPHAYRYPHAGHTTDCVVFAYTPEGLQVLLIKRGGNPCKGAWAFPGGFLELGEGKEETLEDCARRELEEETGLKTADVLEQLHTFSAIDRDPRERVISTVFFTLVRKTEVNGGDDAAEARWWDCTHLPEPLAFDHQEMYDMARKRLTERARLYPIGIDVLPELFTLEELLHFYECLFESSGLDATKFETKMRGLGLIESQGTGHPQKYRFNKVIYEYFKKKGFCLEF